jgi:hypothetical protein
LEGIRIDSAANVIAVVEVVTKNLVGSDALSDALITFTGQLAL